MRAPALLLLGVFACGAAGALAQVDADAGWDDWEEEEDWGSAWDEEARNPWTGFFELGAGLRVRDNPPLDDSATLQEARLRLERSWRPGSLELALKTDLLADGVIDAFRLDTRELALAFSAGGTDFKLGRQVLTWGTGDLLFLNDLFPKDFQSFFAGRDEEYLKAASDTLRFTRFGEVLNLDLAWSPEFEPDRYLTGERFSFFVPPLGAVAAPGGRRVPAPDEFPEDGEVALRAFRTVAGVEWAAYAYRGFSKGPQGVRADGSLFFPRLDVAGASVRRPLGPGLVNAEFAYYDAASPAAGEYAPQDQWRVLLGYEQELVPRLNLGLQAYLERFLNHQALQASWPDPGSEPEETRGVLTARLTYRAFRERLTSSLFVFASPTDEDWHLRPRVDYRYSDAWSFSAGANLFGGEEDFTFFGQLEGNDNVYLRARYSF